MNRLTQKAAFQKALASYQLSNAAKQTLAETKLVLLTAATASGRNTIINQLTKSNDYHYLISDTTRKPRVNNGLLERSGVEYWFRSEAELLLDLQAGSMLEAEIIHGQQVSGIGIHELETACQEIRIAITDIDIGGMTNIVTIKPDTVAILILPPSFEEWQRRIHDRGVMSQDEYYRRLQTAAKIFSAGCSEDYLQIIINDELSETTKQVDELAHGAKLSAELQQKGKSLVKELYDETLNLLQKLA